MVKEEEEPKKGGIKGWWARASKIDKSTIAALGGAALLSYGEEKNARRTTHIDAQL